jgi:hypothetical protein
LRSNCGLGRGSNRNAHGSAAALVEHLSALFDRLFAAVPGSRHLSMVIAGCSSHRMAVGHAKRRHNESDSKENREDCA